MTKCQLLIVLGLLFFSIALGVNADTEDGKGDTGLAIFFLILSIPMFIGAWKTNKNEEITQKKVAELERANEQENRDKRRALEQTTDILPPVVEIITLEKPAQPIRIIHIDDEELVLELVSRMIRANKAFDNVTVQSFQNRDKAWQAVLRADLDLLITDLRSDNIPGQKQNARWNGFDMLTVLAQVEVKYPIIIFSGSLSDEECESKAKRIAGNKLKVSFLKKPATSEQLCSEISKHLDLGIETGNQYSETNLATCPDAFEFQIGGYCGTSHSIKHIGFGKLEYRIAFTQYQWEKPDILNPSRPKWEQFLRELDENGLWKWEADYQNPGVRDGTFWNLKLRIKDRSLISQGKNAYPGGCDGEGEPTGEFLLFLKAVQKLTGKDIR